RHQPAIGDAAGEYRRLLAEQGGTRRRMDPVGPDQHIASNARAVREPGLDTVALVDEAYETMAEMDALRRKPTGDDRQQIGAVNGDVRCAVELFALRIERCALQGATVVPASLMGTERAHTLPQQPVAETEPNEDAGGVR